MFQLVERWARGSEPVFIGHVPCHSHELVSVHVPARASSGDLRSMID